jgi:hypothetical protein
LGLEVDEKQDSPVVEKSEEITAEVVEDMKAQVEQLESQKAELENVTVKAEAQEESEEDNEAADTPDEDESEEGEVEDEEDEEEEEEEEGGVESEEEGEIESEEEEESEDNETEDGEQRVRYLPVVIVKERDNGLPFPIVCASSLLVLIYMFKAFLFLCDMTGCNSNRHCIYLA